ncbi:MAG: long-chain fatty acid--CoA ligase [Alphaproteobacteria bacterium]|nr:MAG: long-chain fatty acid--CoA ligase [Alphaproteobacteria bacterium]
MRLTAAEVEDMTARAARLFEEAGIGPGDRVAMLLRNDPAFIITAIAAGRLGAYAVPINWHFAPPEVRYILDDCGAKLLVAHADLFAATKQALPAGLRRFIVATPAALQHDYRILPDDAKVPAGETDFHAALAGATPLEGREVPPPGSIIYTSGTTGRPKGVRRYPPANMEEYQRGIMTVVYAWGFAEAPIRSVMTGPMYHSAPFTYGTLVVRLGGELHLMGRFDPEELLRMIERHRITHLHMVPTMFIRLLKLPEEVRRRYDLSSLRFVVHGAAPCPAHVKEAMLDWWGDVIYEYYGSTELGILTRLDPGDWRARPLSVGRALPGVKLRILDEAGRELPPGPEHLGEIFARNELVADFTYHGDDAKRRGIEREGFLTNGDMGWMDEDGFLFLEGRSHDMVISGGVNIYPAEIEAALHELPGVLDCGVFGVPDPEFGERLVAVIQPEPNTRLTPEEIRAGLKGRIAGYKIPREILLLPKLPREDTGKIFKRKLKEDHIAGRLG